MGQTIGIDFGTSFSRAAFINSKGRAEMIPDFHSPSGAPLLASIVSITESGAVVVGEDARKQLARVPGSGVAAVKRALMESDKPDKLIFSLKARSLSAREAITAILRVLRERAEAVLKEPVAEAVLGIPESIESHQSEWLEKTAREAGFQKINPVKENEAAAHYLSVSTGVAGIFLVYNFGGGMVQVSIFENQAGRLGQLASAASRAGAGEDLDELITEKIEVEIAGRMNKRHSEDPVLRGRIKEIAVKLKYALSHRGSYDIEIRDEKKGLVYTRAFSRFELEGLAKPLVLSTERLCRQALKQAGLEPGRLEALFFVGGMTRMPLIQRSVESFLGKRAVPSINPDLPVALGAALYGKRTL